MTSIVVLTLTIYTTYISIDSTFKSVIWNAKQNGTKCRIFYIYLKHKTPYVAPLAPLHR